MKGRIDFLQFLKKEYVVENNHSGCESITFIFIKLRNNIFE